MRMRLWIATLLLLPSLAMADAKNCDDMLAGLVARSQALNGPVKMIDDLYAQLDELRKSNGHLNRNSKVLRDRRFTLLKMKLEQGEQAQIAAIYAPIFEKVDLAAHTIRHHLPYLEGEKKIVTNASDAEVQKQLLQMSYEVSKAYKDLGLNYIEYDMAKGYLEYQAKEGRGYVKTQAIRMLERMSLSLRAKQIEELGIDPENPSPTREEVRETFASNIEPLVTLLKHDLEEEILPWIDKYGLEAVHLLEEATRFLG